MPRALRTEGFLGLSGRVFWSEGARFGTVDVHSYLPTWCEQRQATVRGALVLIRNKQMAVSKHEVRNKPAGVGVGDPRTTALEWESDCP